MKNALLAILIICSIPVSAQEGKWHVFTSTDTLNRVALNRLEWDTLVINTEKRESRLPVESIQVIRTMKKSKVGRSLAISVPVGLAVGVVAGAAFGSSAYREPEPTEFPDLQLDIGRKGSAIIGGIAGGVTGAGLGTAIGLGIGNPRNKNFRLYRMDHQQKLQTIWSILTLYDQ